MSKILPFPTFKVGGFVRDGLLGVKSKDLDFAVEAPSFDAMLAAVEARCSKVFEVKPEHFTARGLDPEFGAVDFVLCRKDGPSSDGRHPDFVEAGTILDDLARRDFTVNAMAIAEDGTMLDPHDGRADLEAGVLRFVGDASKRLAEDGLRAFRGVRFAITKGFVMTLDTREAIAALESSDFTAVSTERMREELLRCFAADTMGTLSLLGSFPNIMEVAFSERGLWLKPTSEKA